MHLSPFTLYLPAVHLAARLQLAASLLPDNDIFNLLETCAAYDAASRGDYDAALRGLTNLLPGAAGYDEAAVARMPDVVKQHFPTLLEAAADIAASHARQPSRSGAQSARQLKEWLLKLARVPLAISNIHGMDRALRHLSMKARELAP